MCHQKKKIRWIPIDYLFDTLKPDSVSLNYLAYIFQESTKYSGSYLFSTMYIPVKVVTAAGISDTYSYINIGLSPSELAVLYWTKFSGYYLLGDYCDKDFIFQVDKIKLRITAIFQENLGKYLKLLELQGYEYNPLWNVDGTEIRQNLENRGVNNIEYGGLDTIVGTQYRDTKTTRNTSTYDGLSKEEWNDENAGNGVAPVANAVEYVREITEGTDKGKLEVVAPSLSGKPESVLYNTNGHKSGTKYIHQTAKNIVDGSEVDYAVAASDTAFGTALVGADKMYLEKYIRQGNIGVTKTTDLIESQRNLLKYSIVSEFFKDINEAILIAIYDF